MMSCWADDLSSGFQVCGILVCQHGESALGRIGRWRGRREQLDLLLLFRELPALPEEPAHASNSGYVQNDVDQPRDVLHHTQDLHLLSHGGH